MAEFRHPRWRIWNIAGGEIRFALTDLPPELYETISTLAEQTDAHRAILEFGDFPHRIQRGIGQQIGRRPSGMQSWTVGHVQLAGDLFKPLVHGPEQRSVTE